MLFRSAASKKFAEDARHRLEFETEVRELLRRKREALDRCEESDYYHRDPIAYDFNEEIVFLVEGYFGEGNDGPR